MAYETEISIPFFYDLNKKPLAYINDSLMIDTAGIYLSVKFTESVETDTSGAYLCSSMDLIPEFNSTGYSILINNKSILSFEMNTSYSAGSGGHFRYQFMKSYCYDTQKQKRLLWNDVFIPGCDSIIRKMADTLFVSNGGHFSEDVPDYMKASFDTTNFGLDSTSIVFYYSEYYSGSVSYTIPVSIPYRNVKKYIRPRYRKMIKRSVRS
ncbi:MAG: RsiV family protein [Bacteroidota bacterium]|nr:RsiV family protein [Bacteroidota bacterium]